MKKPIVLTGPSGVGKTTIAQYLERKYPEKFKAFDTGDVFKAKLALAYHHEFQADQVYTGTEAFEWFIKNKFERGVQLYEQLKADGIVKGKDIIAWIEPDRAVCPDLPTRFVRAAAQVYADRCLITSAINNEEFEYLLNEFWGVGVFSVSLNCVDPVKRLSGDNRSPVTGVAWDFNVEYQIQDSLFVAEGIHSRYLNT